MWFICPPYNLGVSIHRYLNKLTYTNHANDTNNKLTNTKVNGTKIQFTDVNVNGTKNKLTNVIFDI